MKPLLHSHLENDLWSPSLRASVSVSITHFSAKVASLPTSGFGKSPFSNYYWFFNFIKFPFPPQKYILYRVVYGVSSTGSLEMKSCCAWLHGQKRTQGTVLTNRKSWQHRDVVLALMKKLGLRLNAFLGSVGTQPQCRQSCHLHMKNQS